MTTILVHLIHKRLNQHTASVTAAHFTITLVSRKPSEPYGL